MRGMWQRWVAVFLLAMAAAHIVVAWQQREKITQGYGDFSSLYTSGWMVRRGMGSRIYDLHAQWRVQQELFLHVEIRQGPMPFIRPPFESLLFVPFSYLTYPVALAAWSALKFVLLWFALKILPHEGPFLRAYPAWFETLLCLGFFPVYLDFFQGQDGVVLLLLFALALRSLNSHRDGRAGVFLALGLFKFHLVIPLVLVLMLTGRRRVLTGFVPTGMTLIGLSWLIAGTGVFRSYPVYLLELNRAVGAGMVTAQSMTNLRGMLTVWTGRMPYPGPVHWMLLPIAIGALWYTARIWSNRTGNPPLVLGYSLAIVTAILTSYYAHLYDLTLLLIPISLVGGSLIRYPSWTRVASGLVLRAAFILVLCTPLYWVLLIYGDRPYLLCLPLMLLAWGLAATLRNLPLVLATFATLPAGEHVGSGVPGAGL